ncbi:hypothetical protein [Herbiconiux sp. YIM B11900]|uniref:hypothetical protein n=1 Tax=Herbiconiux sp. YIM B11900 TaxID=3404131 RepID=UPI003F8342B2
MDIFAAIVWLPLWASLPLSFVAIILVARWLARRRSRPGRLRDGVDGTGRIVSVTTYGRGGSSQGLVTIDLVVEAPGVPATAVRYQRMIMVPRWPEPGDIVPVSIDPRKPERCVILWGELPDPQTLGRERAERLADDLRHGRAGSSRSGPAASAPDGSSLFGSSLFGSGLFESTTGTRAPARSTDWSIRFDTGGATATGPDGVSRRVDSLDGLDPLLARTVRRVWDEANAANRASSFSGLSSSEQQKITDTIERLGHLFR